MAAADWNWLSYVIAGLYSLLLIGCVYGINQNRNKKKYLKAHNEYESNRHVIRWKYRFFWFLFWASMLRTLIILLSVIQQHTIHLSAARNKSAFFYQFMGTLPSILYFTAFSFIIWFFAHLAFHKSPTMKKYITPFFTAINAVLYSTLFILGISTLSTKQYSLLYDLNMPIYALCNIVLAVFFLYLSLKISINVQNERRATIDYVLNKNNTHTLAHHSEHSFNHSQNNAIPSVGGIGGGSGGGGGSGVDSQSRQIYGSSGQPQPPPQQQSQQQSSPNHHHNNSHNDNDNNNTGLLKQTQSSASSGAAQIVPRLVKLSLLCFVCWIIRGGFEFAVRIDASIDTSPWTVPQITFEAFFYFMLEFWPSLFALYLMISKPKKRGKSANRFSMAPSEDGSANMYPAAKDMYNTDYQ